MKPNEEILKRIELANKDKDKLHYVKIDALEALADKWLVDNDWDYSKYGDKRAGHAAYETRMCYEISDLLSWAYQAGYREAEKRAEKLVEAINEIKHELLDQLASYRESLRDSGGHLWSGYMGSCEALESFGETINEIEKQSLIDYRGEK